jgi:tetratricopeptide (TPR) repeat protein
VGQSTAQRADLLQGAAGLSRAGGDYEAALRHFSDALAIRRELGDADAIATALRLVGNSHYELGDPATGERIWLESLEARPADGDQRAAADTLNNLGVAARDRNDFDAAVDYYERSLATFRTLGDEEGPARAVMNVGLLWLDRGDAELGASKSREAVRRFHALGNTWDLVDALDYLGACAGALGDGKFAARILGGSEAVREATGAVRSPQDTAAYDRYVARAREHADPDAFDAEWAEGRTMTVSEIVAFSLEV